MKKSKDKEMVLIFEVPEWRAVIEAEHKRDFTTMLSLATDLHEKYPDRSPAITTLGNAYRYAGMRDKAMDCYNQAIEHDKKLVEMGKEEERALNPITPEYKKRVMKPPRVPNSKRIRNLLIESEGAAARAWNGIGELCDKQGDTAGAMHAWLNAVERHEECPPANYNLGELYGRLDLQDEAIEAFERLVAGASHRHEAWLSLGQALGAAGRYRDAYRALKTSFEFAPGDGQTLFLLGMTFYSLARMEKDQEEFLFADKLFYRQATAYFRAALRKDPDEMIIWHLLAGSLMKSDRYGEAYKLQRKLSRIDKDEGDALLMALEGIRKEGITPPA